MTALKDFNLPKIVTEDKPIFLGLIGDLFPGVPSNTKGNPVMDKGVKDTSREEGLIPDDMFVTKVVSLSEILVVRHCCFIIGPPGCGKTTVWQTLAKY